jgi:hypothetical protein
MAQQSGNATVTGLQNISEDVIIVLPADNEDHRGDVVEVETCAVIIPAEQESPSQVESSNDAQESFVDGAGALPPPPMTVIALENENYSSPLGAVPKKKLIVPYTHDEWVTFFLALATRQKRILICHVLLLVLSLSLSLC